MDGVEWADVSSLAPKIETWLEEVRVLSFVPSFRSSQQGKGAESLCLRRPTPRARPIKPVLYAPQHLPRDLLPVIGRDALLPSSAISSVPVAFGCRWSTGQTARDGDLLTALKTPSICRPVRNLFFFFSLLSFFLQQALLFFFFRAALSLWRYPVALVAALFDCFFGRSCSSSFQQTDRQTSCALFLSSTSSSGCFCDFHQLHNITAVSCYVAGSTLLVVVLQL